MSLSSKADFYNALKAEGYAFKKHYRDYTTAELRELYESEPQPAPPADTGNLPEPEPAAEAPRPPQPQAPRASKDPDEMPAQRLNTRHKDEVIRVDENGLAWLQEEIRKPGYAKPRGRRVLKYVETGTKTETVQNGEYLETFEVAGEGPRVAGEVKVTLPSYQVGKYRDPRLPFLVHIYNENRGFDFFEVQRYYGGAEMVPPEIKRIYVENVLCYDIPSTVRAIQTEYRQLQLSRKV